MDKRDRFVAELRKEAKARKLPFKVEKWRGKGGHATVDSRQQVDHASPRGRSTR